MLLCFIISKEFKILENVGYKKKKTDCEKSMNMLERLNWSSKSSILYLSILVMPKQSLMNKKSYYLNAEEKFYK